MVVNIKCLCTSCGSGCGTCYKTEMALKGKLAYVYLKNGDKFTYSCEMYQKPGMNPFSRLFSGKEGLLNIS